MSDSQLLASVAVFRELYDNSQFSSVLDIVGEFIKGAVVYENAYSLTSTGVRALLKRVYDFQIPEAVVRTTLNKRLKNKVTRGKDGIYIFDRSIKDEMHSIESEFESVNHAQNQILGNLISYVESKLNRALTEREKSQVLQDFSGFLLEDNSSNGFLEFITAFVVRNEKDSKFTEQLNQIKEGVVLYEGIRFTANINELGKWRHDLTVYLSPEHLFSALGYNGQVFKEVFDDFLKLVKEINFAKEQKGATGQGKIELRYFEETKREVDDFFFAAEKIIAGQRPGETTRPAMEVIVKSCRSASEVKEKRIRFEMDLRNLGIYPDERSYNVMTTIAENVEGRELVDEIREQQNEKGRGFNEDEISQCLRLFTKINYLRKGDSRRPFEQIGYVLLSENSLIRYLSHHRSVKFSDFDTPFAADLDFITTRLWWNLKKGFSDKQGVPKSFDVITKAKIVLASHVSNSVANSFRELIRERKEGRLTQEEAIERSYQLRERVRLPELLNAENVDNSLDFLSNDKYFEELKREQEKQEILLRETQEELAAARAEISRRDEQERNQLEEQKQRDEIARRDSIAAAEWDSEKDKHYSDLRYLGGIVVLNFAVAIVPVSFSVFLTFREWLVQWGTWQILVLVAWISLIVGEILGRSYLFDKERIKRGWRWFLLVISPNRYQERESEFKETRKQELLSSASPSNADQS